MELKKSRIGSLQNCYVKFRKGTKQKKLSEGATDNSIIKEFKKLRKEVKTSVIKANRNFLLNKIDSLDRNFKIFWHKLGKIAPVGEKLRERSLR